jgi:hypothetical protein
MHPHRAASILAVLRQNLEQSWRRVAGDSEQRYVVVQTNTIIGLIDLWQHLEIPPTEILLGVYQRLDAVGQDAHQNPDWFTPSNGSGLQIRARLEAVNSWSNNVRLWICDRQLESISAPDRVQAGVELLNRLVPFWPFLISRQRCLQGDSIIDQVFRYNSSANSAVALDRVVVFLGSEAGPLGFAHWWHLARGFGADYTPSKAESDRRKRSLGLLWWQAAVRQRCRLITRGQMPIHGIKPRIPAEVHDFRSQTVYGTVKFFAATFRFRFEPFPGEADADRVIEGDELLEDIYGYTRRWRVLSIRNQHGKGIALKLRRIWPAL